MSHLLHNIINCDPHKYLISLRNSSFNGYKTFNKDLNTFVKVGPRKYPELLRNFGAFLAPNFNCRIIPLLKSCKCIADSSMESGSYRDLVGFQKLNKYEYFLL